ncbi:MAG: hypothetical protein HYW23_04045 [Candidatus Aenigmarchaeota archaeon]|nr:hypothetical protein [Candidatus Aenigmarchaeota archaeon]
MKLRKEIILLSVISIVFLAGCTGSSTAGGSAGVIVKEFSASPQSVESGTPITLTLTLKNTGENDATGLAATLSGLPTDFSASAQGSSTGINLFGANPQLGTSEGQDQNIIWLITTKARSTTNTYNVGSRITYTYASQAEATIRVVNVNYYRTLSSSNQQSLQRGVIAQQSQKGPLSVTFTSPAPLISGSPTIPVQIEVQNIGGGRAYTGSDSTSLTGLDRVTVSLTSSSSSLTNCNTQIVLIGGKGRLTCYLSVTTNDVSQYPIGIQLSYNYLLDVSTSFTLIKAFSPPSSTSGASASTPPTTTQSYCDSPQPATVTSGTSVVTRQLSANKPTECINLAVQPSAVTPSKIRITLGGIGWDRGFPQDQKYTLKRDTCSGSVVCSISASLDINGNSIGVTTDCTDAPVAANYCIVAETARWYNSGQATFTRTIDVSLV